MSNLEATSGDITASVELKRPRFSDLWNAYSEVGAKKASEVYPLVGGHVAKLYESDPISYANACALRMSRGFNYGGFPVPSGTIIETYPIYRVRGADQKAYILRVKDLIKYIEFNWGNPEYEMDPTDISEISGKKGVIIISVSGWNDASGHVTLWDGSKTGDGSSYQDPSYFPSRYPDGTVKAKKVMLWELKD
ncbi:type VI secretion system amidase effector protein Tae4 [Vibrio sp. NTOU-M3]|uniref:type VI secretion system amidase effector protein Tae4 n=1 Tax=Vibrio sp. NTOU-M3 TaxID=3234954 RepID=UPI00349F9C30